MFISSYFIVYIRVKIRSLLHHFRYKWPHYAFLASVLSLIFFTASDLRTFILRTENQKIMRRKIKSDAKHAYFHSCRSWIYGETI